MHVICEKIWLYGHLLVLSLRDMAILLHGVCIFLLSADMKHLGSNLWVIPQTVYIRYSTLHDSNHAVLLSLSLFLSPFHCPDFL